MIKGIYIDNYQCLVNFRIELDDFQLWLGDNGSGKTSVLDVLRSIQKLLRGENVEDIFSINTLTKWDSRLKQTFALELVIDGELFEYELILEHSRQENRQRISSEKLLWEHTVFYLFDGHEAHLYRINRDTNIAEEGAVFPAGWERSVIPTIAERSDNEPLTRFRKELEKILLVHPVPLLAKTAAANESRNLSEYAENFAQWYRHLLQEYPSVAYHAAQLLADVLQGFEQLRLRDSGESRKLMATFRIDGEEHDFDFIDLSDGQRQLIILYIMAEALRAGTYSTVFIDEPDNFVAIREIQPWLLILNDICDEERRQAVIISHHPEIINEMVRGTELWFSRKFAAQAVTQPFPEVANLSPAEVMARGWEHE